MIVADTSAIFALLNKRDQHHKTMHALFQNEQRIFIPVTVMAEIAYLVEEKLGPRAIGPLLEDIEAQKFLLEYEPKDIPRIRELALKYADLPLGFCDASVIAMAERRGGRVATVDQHFEIVKAKKPLTLLPQLR